MKVLVEDTGVGTGLIAELKDLGILAVGVKPEGNKLARMATIGQIRG
jgi:phage terminase large subunit-like protein